LLTIGPRAVSGFALVALSAVVASAQVPSPPPGGGDAAISTGSAAGAVPVWQAPAVPQAVVRGGAIPVGWQPQAIPYHGIGPDGRPVTTYVAPTYVFTYQAGPPVPAAPVVNRSQARPAAAQAYPAGWNFATSGAQPASTTLPATTVARYPPPYQFPSDSRALTGTPVVPPAGTPAPAVAAVPTPASPPAAPVTPPPSEWTAAAPSPMAPPSVPPSGDWVTVVPPAVAAAALGSGASAAAVAASDPALAPVQQPALQGVPAQPVSLPTQPASLPAGGHTWRVVGVHDGDTITCLDETNQQQKVRLAAIDAPEVGQEYGRASREALAAMVFGKTVSVADEGRDQYGRWIGRVNVDGLDVNRQMIATGNAWHFTEFSNDPTLAALQEQARSQKIGLWSQPDPIPPWQYRNQGPAS